MCTGAELALIATAASTATKAVNANQAMRRQDRELARGIREQSQLQREANQRIDEQVQDIAGSTGAEERAQSLAGFQDALRRSDESATDAIGGAGAALPAANPRFAERVSQGEAEVRGDALSRAGRLSRIDAPRFQRMNEGSRFGRTATDVNEIGRQSDAADFIARLRASEQQPNPWIDALADIVRGGASVYALSPGAGSVAPVPNAGKLARQGTIMDPVGTTVPRGNPYMAALRRDV